MLAQDWMSKKVIVIEASQNMSQASKLMLEHGISMLPVMEDGKLVGIVTDRDLKRAGPSDITLMEIKHILYHLTSVQVRSIMSDHPVTIPPDFTLEEAAETLLKHKISGCPVVDYTGDIVGVITRNDIFRALISLTGLSKRGVQFGFLLEDRPGSIKEVADILRRFGSRLVSVVSTYEGAPPGYRFAYIRAFSVNRDQLDELEAELKSSTEMLYMVDLKENRRVVYSNDSPEVGKSKAR